LEVAWNKEGFLFPDQWIRIGLRAFPAQDVIPSSCNHHSMSGTERISLGQPRGASVVEVDEQWCRPWPAEIEQKLQKITNRTSRRTRTTARKYVNPW
jgi:hypothetical protein